jgi:hypothetical protein
MRVDHCRAHVFVSDHFLHGTNIIALFQTMRRKKMAKNMTGHLLSMSAILPAALTARWIVSSKNVIAALP